MPTKIIMPKLGFDMSSGKVVRWLKKVGDPVQKGEAVLEIETDKNAVEVPADVDGTLGTILVQEGDVPVGETVGEILGAGEKAAGPAPSKPAGKTASKAPTAAGNAARGQAADLTASAPTEKDGQTSANTSAKVEVVPAGGHIDASPLARRMAAEKGIDLAAVKGSGPGGRITKEDIESYQLIQPKPATAQPMVAPAPVAERAAARPAVAAQSVQGEQPLSRMRQTIARRMSESKGPVPQFYLTSEVDIAAGNALVSQLNEAGKAEDLRVSPLTLVMKACALALRKYPNLNASFGGDKIIYHDFVNISVAVAVEGGLLTPVIADCDSKPVAQLARETRAAAERARSGKMAPSDMAQGTFSISNLGMFDLNHFIAIVSPPEAAIMALGTAKEVPVVEGGQIKIGWRMNLTLSADHRVTDGAEGARFLQEVKRLLQTPLSLFL